MYMYTHLLDKYIEVISVPENKIYIYIYTLKIELNVCTEMLFLKIQVMFKQQNKKKLLNTTKITFNLI